MRFISVMEWNSKNPSEWDWENLAMYGGGKANEFHKQIKILSHEPEGNEVGDNGPFYSLRDGGLFGSSIGHGSSSKSSVSASMHDSSSQVGTRMFGEIDGFPKDLSEEEDFSGVEKSVDFPNMGAPVSSTEHMIGLKLGRRTYFEDMCAASTTITTTSLSVVPPSPCTTIKRSRASYQSSQSPRCQVEGCNLDLVSAKDYHRRHRICETHSKSPNVTVAGMERRFCQQCSRFHDLLEFDDKKRSCRRRLSDHNARRRRPQPDAIQFSSGRLSSSFCDQRPQMNFMLNRFPMAAPSQTWEGDCNLKVTLARDSVTSLAKGGAIGRKANFPSDAMPNTISTLHLDTNRVSSVQGTTHRFHNHGLEASIASNMDVAPELPSALSLLSSNSWGSVNEHVPTSLEQLMHGNHVTVAQPVMQSIPHNWSVAPVEQASKSRVHSSELQNIGNTQFQEFQEFQLFKTPHESDCFYSNQIDSCFQPRRS